MGRRVWGGESGEGSVRRGGDQSRVRGKSGEGSVERGVWVGKGTGVWGGRGVWGGKGSQGTGSVGRGVLGGECKDQGSVGRGE